MRNRLPKITDKYKICIICEGNEECSNKVGMHIQQS